MPLSQRGAHANKRNHAVASFFIDGCAVSISSTQDAADEPLKAVKDILLAAYKPCLNPDKIDARVPAWDNNSGRCNTVYRVL